MVLLCCPVTGGPGLPFWASLITDQSPWRTEQHRPEPHLRSSSFLTVIYSGGSWPEELQPLWGILPRPGVSWGAGMGGGGMQPGKHSQLLSHCPKLVWLPAVSSAVPATHGFQPVSGPLPQHCRQPLYLP